MVKDESIKSKNAQYDILTLMVFVWKYLISPLGGVFGIYELLPAFLFSLAACVVVSLATPAPGADIEAEFEAAK